MVMAGRSVHLTTLFFLGKLEQAVNQYLVHILSLAVLTTSTEIILGTRKCGPCQERVFIYFKLQEAVEAVIQ